MFIALFSTILQSFSDIFWKKSLGYGVGGKAHELLSYPVGVLICIYFFINGFQINEITLLLFVSVFIIVFIDILKGKTQQDIYRTEKISVIMPYTNINKILIIISSFFLFHDVSVISLGITLVAILFVAGFSIDLKTLKFPKKIIPIIIIEIARAISGILAGWIILTYSEVSYFITYTIIGIIFTSLVAWKLQQFSTIKGKPKAFWFSRYLGGLGWISWFLAMVVVKNLGLSISILLGFLGVGVSLLFSFFILKDKPSKKDLLLTVIVTILVGLGFYFK